VKLLSRLLVPISLAALSACHQGLGQHCQSDADCTGGLVCARAENVCSTTNSTGSIDANPPQPPPDAAPDAPIDAT
jgi:hypothetical protein